MKTAEILFNQIADQKIFCPCEEHCPSYKALIEKSFQRSSEKWFTANFSVPAAIHLDYNSYITCITRFSAQYIRDHIVDMRASAVKNLKLPMETFKIFEGAQDGNSEGAEAFKIAALEFKLHFADTRQELESLINRNLFSICENVI